MSDSITYKEVLQEHNRMHSQPKGSKHKALKHILTGRSQKEQMRFTRQNRAYQDKIGRAQND